MEKTTFECQFTLLGKKVQMFHAGDMGIVIEKEPDVVCVYATDAVNSHILCAVPLGSPKALKGTTYRIAFFGDGVATVSVGSGILYFDFGAKKFAGNLPFHAFGSEDWGQDVSMPWQGEYAKRI